MIVFFAGPEGGGKTVLMTYHLRRHHLMGGEIWAFPGYEHKNQTGRVVSLLVYPEEVMGRLNEMDGVVVVIDEIQNFLNHHAWKTDLADFMAYGAAAQRRKRGFNILATGPELDWVPLDLRLMFHEVWHCRDRHWRHHGISRGSQIEFTITDRRGVLSGIIGATTRPKLFYPKKYYPYFDTFSLVDPKYLHHRVKVKKQTTVVDDNGNIIGPIEPNMNIVEDYIVNDNRDSIDQAIKAVLAKLITAKKETVPIDLFRNVLGGNMKVIGAKLKRLGVSYDRNKQEYRLAGANLDM